MTDDARGTTQRLLQKIERTTRGLGFRAYQALTSATPVRYGFARAGWSMSAGAPKPGPPVPPQVEEAARAQAAALFQQHTREAELLRSGYTLGRGPIFIVNPVVYIRPLNTGTSAQAPAMFVERAIQTAIDQTRAALAAGGDG